jgi:tetratricopeptide (TPR) repeat protein
MLDLFNQARNIQNSDSELLTALSVLHFINRDYDSAVQCFKEALECDP